MKRYLKNPYFITILLSVVIFLILFIGKGIFPFGENTLIFGDMHDQITAFYYHFYDAFHENRSLMINFTTSGGINFLGIMAYYILSPFSFLFLLFSREDIYMAVSVVIALKMIVASVTCLYALRYFFKEKLPFLLSVVLALSYAFSGYNLILYQITPWMDAMYLFPLVVVGLKKVLDLEKPYLYIITLMLSFIFSFYVSSIGLLFIFFISFVYIFNCIKKEERKKSITALGITTVLAVGLSMIIILPSFMEILDSSRLGFDLLTLLNSKTGPITDKVSYFLPSAFLIVANLLLFLDYKKHIKFLKWYFPTVLLLGIPYIVEPINKVFHFFSYAFFPNRYGYILFFILTIGASYYFIEASPKKEENSKKRTALAITITLLCSVVAIILTYLNYSMFQEGVYKLTISKDRSLIFFISFVAITVMIGITSIIYSKKNNKMYYYILVISIVHILCNTYLYMGIDSKQEVIKKPYEAMNEISKTYRTGDFYRLKTNTSSLITNNGMVTRYHNLDHFTSLVKGDNLKFLKQLGFSSHWTKTYSKNGTMFSDSLVANKYYLTKAEPNDEWYYGCEEINEYNFCKFKKDLSYGYFTKNIEFNEDTHVFDFQNDIYRAITGKKDNLFEVYKSFKVNNLDVTKNKDRTSYKIIDNDAVNYLSIDIPVKDRSAVYLEIFNSFNNTDDDAIYKRMKIYVNDMLYKSSYPLPASNGSLYLGTFEEESVNIKVEFIYDTELSYIEVGVMDKEKLFNFIDEEKVDSTVSFEKNNVRVKVNSEKDGLFFIPVTYGEGFSAKVDGKIQKIVSVYDNFLGVELTKGNHEIEFSYVCPGLKIASVISISSLIIMIVLFSKGLYFKLLESSLFTKIIEYIYLGIYFIGFISIYLVPFICFILSYFFYIS